MQSLKNIGLGITRALLERGYRVVGNSRTIGKSKELKASTNLALADGDISKKETAIAVAGAAITHLGRIDVPVKRPRLLPKQLSMLTPFDRVPVNMKQHEPLGRSPTLVGECLPPIVTFPTPI